MKTGITSLDHLHGEIIGNELIEWSGLPASGKTQLSFYLLLYCACQSQTGNIYYFDSGGSFSAKRLSQLFDNCLALKPFRKLKQNAFKRIFKVNVFHVDDLYKSLKSLQSPILLIIDSLSDILLPLVNQKSQICDAIQVLKEIARTKSIPIICINSSVGQSKDSHTFGFINTPRSLATRTKPALGQYWSNILSKRIYFSPSAERMAEYSALLTANQTRSPEVLSMERDGLTFSVIECILERIVDGKLRSISLYIGKFDIFA